MLKSHKTYFVNVVVTLTEAHFVTKLSYHNRENCFLYHYLKGHGLWKSSPPIFCIVIDPDAASFPAMPNAFIPSCSYKREPITIENRIVVSL